ncbi:MAG TPA: hypothetical protein VFP34_13165 [Microlunatus sp.]|nr:hypothetical protein [Microlunatus sp.]
MPVGVELGDQLDGALPLLLVDGQVTADGDEHRAEKEIYIGPYVRGREGTPLVTPGRSTI